ncbi:hypothetical protein [Streptomyces sp. CB03234]|uniref:hypothetical protein n=1 Tax=Streptomyces sp. (strain CB03234) TaxID=1703937 RepID=UPI0013015893|nr:hypothetical protein [Streptomyces sp. CB03234]
MGLQRVVEVLLTVQAPAPPRPGDAERAGACGVPRRPARTYGGPTAPYAWAT